MYGPDDKELRAFLQAMNRQMKTDERSFGNSNCLPVPITVSAKDHVDDSFHDPGEESESMQGSVHGDAQGMLNLRFRLVMDMILWMSWRLAPGLCSIFISGLPLVRASLS